MSKLHKIAYLLMALAVALFIVIFSVVGGGMGVTYAATSAVTQFESTDVMDDLKNSTIDGKPFSVLNYPYDSTGQIKSPEILTVVEYCYSYRPAQRGNYGLYIYFYNPQALNISSSSPANKITLAVAWETDGEGNLRACEYEKFNLQYCSKSTGDYNNLFYKFKVIDHKSTIDGKTMAERVNSNARRYDISEVELLTYGDRNATAYSVGGSYTFTGYAEGYGADSSAESTLSCTWQGLETITLDLAGVTDGIDKRTYWRSDSVSSLGKGHQNQINSVFFAIDNEILQKYGGVLQRIKAEWWEYKTVPAVVVEDTSVYNALKDYVGEQIDLRGDKYWASNTDVPYAIGSTKSISSGELSSYIDLHYGWNLSSGTYNANGDSLIPHYRTQVVDYEDDLLPILFNSGGMAVNDYVLSAEDIQTYFENYDKSYIGGNLSFNGHDYSADLFVDGADEGRTRGYNMREFDISDPDDYYNLLSYDSTHNWWQKFQDYGFGSINTSDEYLNVAPIERVTDSHIASSDIANVLMINADDVSVFKDFYNKSVSEDKSVFIFRYAFTDYLSASAYVLDSQGSEVSSAEVRQGTQFFDFDILQMTFNRNGELTTLGCVSSPVDHWSDYTPALVPEAPDWLQVIKLILGLICLIIIIIILWPVLRYVVSAVVWVITLPFKAIAKLFKKKE